MDIRYSHKTPQVRQILYALIGLTIFYHSSALGQIRGIGTDQGFTVVIDAGHGGKDPGCMGPHSHEKEICLNVALKLGAKIKADHPGVSVIYTRDKDIFIPLKERAAIANKESADIFISLHCNYVGKKDHVHGSETYVMGLHKTSQNLAVASRENSVIELEDDRSLYSDFDPNSPLGLIILQNLQNSNLAHSIRVANLIQTELETKLNRANRGVKQAGFIVLYYTTMPAVLVEMGFLSHKEEEAFLRSEEGATQMAQTLAGAFSKYFDSLGQPLRSTQPAELLGQNKTQAIEKRFKVQIAASRSKPIAQTTVGPWQEVKRYEVIEEDGLFKYLTGNFRSLSEASKEKNRLRQAGFNGAFVVAYLNEERTSITD